MYTNIVTSNASFTGAEVIEKVIAYEVPLAMAQDRERAFRLFRLKEFSAPMMFERGEGS
jgi:hypothetical protein